MLKITDLHVHYGGIHALKGVSLSVEEGQIVSLIGANGAGKSTCLNTISSLVPASSGQIIFMENDITKSAPHSIVKSRLIQVPEGRKVFPQMSVAENLEMGAYVRTDKREVKADRERVLNMFPRLRERERQLAGTLSGGEQQMLAIARGIMAKPRILLLDEPSMGLAPILVQEIFSIIREINAQGTTILLVEQNAHMALSIANYGYVLETGRVVLEGPATELAANDEIRSAYLGA